jgi:hypothetical protein
MVDLEKYRDYIEEIISYRAKHQYVNSSLQKSLFLTATTTDIC